MGLVQDEGGGGRGEGGKNTGYPKTKRKETQSRRRQRTFAERLNGMSLISIGAVDKCFVPSPTKSQILFISFFCPPLKRVARVLVLVCGASGRRWLCSCGREPVEGC